MRRTLLGVAFLVVALPGCSADGPTPVPPPTAPAVTAPDTAVSKLGGAPGPAGALDGERQVFLLPRLDDSELPDSVLGVTRSGRVQVTDDGSDRALFVLVPRGGGSAEKLIKTGSLRRGGESLCLQVETGGVVVTAACDAGRVAQRFSFDKSGEDDEGDPVYAVRNRDAFLQWHPLGDVGLVAAELGGAELATTFTVRDQGRAALPRDD